MSEAVRQFEEAFARWLGVRSAFAFWKGRVALYVILRALGIGEGDEVILPGYTCVVAVNPIKMLGAKPVYVDIEPVTYNIAPEQIEAKITPRTRLILAQHTYGYPAEMDAILDIARRRSRGDRRRAGLRLDGWRPRQTEGLHVQVCRQIEVRRRQGQV